MNIAVAVIKGGLTPTEQARILSNNFLNARIYEENGVTYVAVANFSARRQGDYDENDGIHSEHMIKSVVEEIGRPVTDTEELYTEFSPCIRRSVASGQAYSYMINTQLPHLETVEFSYAYDDAGRARRRREFRLIWL